MIGLYLCNLPRSPNAPIDPLHFLSHCGVGNGDIEEKGGKRIMKESEKFSFAKVPSEFDSMSVLNSSLSLPSSN